ncbi:probable aminotransferase TAT2 [Tanacetum coccineum]
MRNHRIAKVALSVCEVGLRWESDREGFTWPLACNRISDTEKSLRIECADYCNEGLKDVPGVTCPTKPAGAMCVMVKLDMSVFKDIKDDMDFCVKLAREESVLFLPDSECALKGIQEASWRRKHSEIHSMRTKSEATRSLPYVQRPWTPNKNNLQAVVTDGSATVSITCFSDQANSFTRDCNDVLAELTNKDLYQLPPSPQQLRRYNAHNSILPFVDE